MTRCWTNWPTLSTGKTAACMSAKNDIPVKAIASHLGHNNITTTMRYIDVFNEDMEKTKNILDNLV